MEKGKKRINRSKMGDFTMFFVLLIFAAIMAIPLIYTVSEAFKPLEEFWTWPPTMLPKNPTLEAFTQLGTIFDTSWVPFSRYLFNTVLITIVATFGHIILACMASYSLSLFKFPGAKTLLEMVRLALMFVTTVLQVPNYVIISKLGIADTYWAVIFPNLGTSLGLYLMTGFMAQIPYSIIEAARIDGASHWRVFWKIVMPQVKSAWLTLLIFQLQAVWVLSGTSEVVFSEQIKSLQQALNNISSVGLARQNVAAAITVLMMAVPITVFVVTQSNIIETMATSGMKD